MSSTRGKQTWKEAANESVLSGPEEDPEELAEREYALKNAVKTETMGNGVGGDVVVNGFNAPPPRNGRRSYSTSDAIVAPAVAPVVVPQASRSSKNARKSRGKAGRGEPKKNGGGGKYTWGKRGEVYDESLTMDPNDPNYDSDDVLFEEDELKEVRTKELGADGLETVIVPLAKDYLSSGDVRQTADELHAARMSSECRAAFVTRLCHLSIDGHDAQREMACVLVEHMVHRSMLSQTDVARAMRQLVSNDLGDLAIDYPTVGDILGSFLARFIADHALDESIVEQWYKEKTDEGEKEYGRALERCRSLLCQPNAMARLHDVWGVGGGQRPVRQLSHHIQLIVKEYLTNNDVQEAARSLKHLQVPHFRHEMVFQTSLMAVESMHTAVCLHLLRLLVSLLESGNISSDCVEMGIDRFYSQLGDIELDLPPAYTLAERWVKMLREADLISVEQLRRLPKGVGRKRFMSEGDGGRLTVLEA